MDYIQGDTGDKITLIEVPCRKSLQSEWRADLWWECFAFLFKSLGDSGMLKGVRQSIIDIIAGYFYSI
jgi:hypothetical protein